MRATSSVVIFWAIVAACGVLLGDALVRGRWDVAFSAAPTLGFVGWVGWVVFYRPALRLSNAGASVVGLWKTTTAPWEQIRDITTRLQVVVILRSGEWIRCWGAPIRSRRMRRGGEPRSAAHDVIDGWWARHELEAAGEASVSKRWHWRSIAVGAALALAVALQAFLAAAPALG